MTWKPFISKTSQHNPHSPPSAYLYPRQTNMVFSTDNETINAFWMAETGGTKEESIFIVLTVLWHSSALGRMICEHTGPTLNLRPFRHLDKYNDGLARMRHISGPCKATDFRIVINCSWKDCCDGTVGTVRHSGRTRCPPKGRRHKG